MNPTPPTIDAPERREAAIKAVAQIEMDREGYPLSRHLDEIYTDAAETVDAVLGIFAVSAVGRREAVARLIDPNAWYHRDNGRVAWGGDIDGSLAKADAILELLAASSGERIASSDEMLCEGCGKSINRGQFVHVYDDVGEVHVDCDQPNAFSDDPMAMVMVGDPMRRIAPSAKASSGERGAWQDGLWQIVLSVHGDRVRSTETNIALREALSKAAKQFRSYEKAHNEKNTDDGDKKAVTNAEFAVMCERAANLEPRQSKAEIMAEIRALATPATVEEGKV